MFPHWRDPPSKFWRPLSLGNKTIWLSLEQEGRADLEKDIHVLMTTVSGPGLTGSGLVLKC